MVKGFSNAKKAKTLNIIVLIFGSILVIISIVTTIATTVYITNI